MVMPHLETGDNDMAFPSGKLHHNYKHGQGGRNPTGAYRSWVSMIDRCNPRNADTAPNYAGIGITVCERWANSFEDFYADMGDRPEGFSIDRIDSTGNYEPGNCRWADKNTQAENRCTTVYIEINGERLFLSEASKKYGIPMTTLSRRLRQGVTGKKLVCKRNRNTLRVGSKTPGAKLTESDVEEIKLKMLNGARNVSLSAEYGVSGSVISEIRHNKLWAHVPWPNVR